MEFAFETLNIICVYVCTDANFEAADAGFRAANECFNRLLVTDPQNIKVLGNYGTTSEL